MKHSGKALQAGLKLIFWSAVVVMAIFATGVIAKYLHYLITTLAIAVLAVWALFIAFTVYFFRDPDPVVPTEPGLILSPGHGTVDWVDEAVEPEFMGGSCKRISMFLSPLDVHVQKALVAGEIGFVKHNRGQFRAAMDKDCGLYNENVLIGIKSSEVPGEKIGVRLVAGTVARRIIPWVTPGDVVARGERISLIQFGSRCDIYLPHNVKITVKVGDKLRGGESEIARHA